MNLHGPLLLLLLPISGIAQEVRLLDRIERPMAYVVHDAGAVANGTGQANPVLALLAEPSLQESFADGNPTLGIVRRVVARAAGEVEMALTGILPAAVGAAGRGGMPLVVMRARLGSEDADRMRELLGAGATAQPLRVVDGHRVYRLDGRTAAGRAPGYQVEAAMVGMDFVVANHGSGLDEALGGSSRPARRPLGSDPRFVALMERLQPSGGAVVAFADWQRFGRRLASASGLSGSLLHWSGLGGAEAVLASIESRQCGRTVAPTQDIRTTWQSTVLMSFPPGSSINGWLSLVEPAPAKRLLAELPVGGLGGLVLSLEPGRMLAQLDQRRADKGQGPALDGLGFANALAGSCGQAGVDLDRVVGRLGQRGAMQLLWLPDEARRLTPVFALQVKNSKVATGLLEEIGRAAQQNQRGSSIAAQGRGLAQVELRGIGGLQRIRLGVVDNLLLFAHEAVAVDGVALEWRRNRGSRSRLGVVVRDALHALSGDRQSLSSVRVGGIVHFDAADWLESIGTNSGWPTRHTGRFDVFADVGPVGTVVRLQLFSSHAD